jgi:hypothetical protein
MQPRIYVYKITFVDQLYWYWGIHKERKFDEYYMGSPVTYKQYWEIYTPVKEILETFEYSEEGWKHAQLKEIELIKQDLENPLCLNQGCCGLFSLESLKKAWNNPEYRKHQSEVRRGANNPQYETRFIHNLESFENKRIKKSEKLPKGWGEGPRFSKMPKADQEKLSRDRTLARRMKLGSKPDSLEEAEFVLRIHEEAQLSRELNKQALIVELEHLYPLYITGGFKAVVESGYDKSQVNLVKLFSKYVPDFKPQMGKKRAKTP